MLRPGRRSATTALSPAWSKRWVEAVVEPGVGLTTDDSPNRQDDSAALCAVRPSGACAGTLRPATLGRVSVRVRFVGGPADGLVHDYPAFTTALPSLYWSGDAPPWPSAVYRRDTDLEPDDHVWPYRVVPERAGAENA